MNTHKDRYTEYITSDKWFQVRRKVFGMYGRECKRCNSKKKIHVHHKTYERFGEECLETDLVVLCKKCHDIYHTIYKHTSIDTTDSFVLDKELLLVSNTKKKVMQMKQKRADKKKDKISKQKIAKTIKFVASINNKKVSNLKLHSPLTSNKIELLNVDK